MAIRNKRVGEVLVYLLGFVAFLLVLPVGFPIVMWLDWRGYAEKLSWLPGIRNGGGIVSAIAAIIYVLVIGSVVGGAAIMTTGSGIGDFDSGSEGSAGVVNETETPTPVETGTPHPITETATPTTTPTPTPTEPTRAEKYERFADDYIGSLEDDEFVEVNVVNYSLHPGEKRMALTYEMKDPSDPDVRGNETDEVTIQYNSWAHHYRIGEFEGVDETYVPRTVNITAVTPEGEVYRQGYVKYEWVVEHRESEITALRYVLRYYRYAEPGPANPDYEGDEQSTG